MAASLIVKDRGHIPGGWHSGFNRVYQWGYFAHLKPSIAKVYKILEWQADYRNEFIVRDIGYAKIGEYAGVGWDTVHRAIRTLETLGLIETVRSHRYLPGANQAKQYQLRVPAVPYTEKLDNLTDKQRDGILKFIEICDTNVWGGSPRGRHPDSPRATTKAASRQPPSTPVAHKGGGSSASGIKIASKISSSKEPDGRLPDAVALLSDAGIEEPVRSRLAAAYPIDYLSIKVTDYHNRRRAGEQKGVGYLVRAIEGGDSYPLHKSTVQQIATEKRRAAAIDSQSKQSDTDRQRESKNTYLEEQFAELDDEELAILIAKAKSHFGRRADKLGTEGWKDKPSLRALIFHFLDPDVILNQSL